MTEAPKSLNVYFDVDHTLVYTTQEMSSLRPGAREAMARLKEAGHSIYVWSAGGQLYSERTVKKHGLTEWVDGCFDKDPRVDPLPDLIIDDDWYLVEKYGGYCVSQYKEVDENDRELLEIVDKLTAPPNL